MKRLFLFLLSFLLMPPGILVQAQRIRAATGIVPTESKKTPVVTPAMYQNRQIMVGNGGGFTGFTTTYYLLENGKLFGRRSRDTTFTFVSQQSVAQTKRLFAMAESTCKIKKTKFNYPGNTYKFARWRKGKLEYTVTWGAVKKTVPANYPKFYDSFVAMIPVSSRLK